MRTLSALSLRRRIEICFLMAALDLPLMLLPELQRTHYLTLLATVLVSNAVVGWWVLKDVPASRDASMHRVLAALAKRWVSVLFVSFAAVLLLGGLSGNLTRQSLPFFFCSLMLVLAAIRILQISVAKRIDELSVEH